MKRSFAAGTQFAGKSKRLQCTYTSVHRVEEVFAISGIKSEMSIHKWITRDSACNAVEEINPK